MPNKHLQSAKNKKNDEYYTQYNDIQNWFKNVLLSQKPDFLKDKVVVCFADGPTSEFVNFFINNFDRLGLKGLIHTCYLPDSDFQQAPVKTKKGWGDIYWKGNGSFWEQDYLDNLNKLKQKGLDLVLVTNPPFSNSRLTKKFLSEVKLPFVVVASTTWRTGYWPFNKLNCFSGPEYFKTPSGEKARCKTNWWTNINLKKDRKLHGDYETVEWNGYNVRVIDKMGELTKEKGVVWGVPITWELYDTEEWLELGCKKLIVNGKAKFDRVIVTLKGGEWYG